MSIWTWIQDLWSPYHECRDFEAPGALAPVYFVRHLDDTYSIALPQPTMNPREDSLAKAEIVQLKFLLSQCPMITAPAKRSAAASVRSPYAYIHPKTFAKYSTDSVSFYGRVLGSPTKWVMTTAIPEGCVIYSPNTMPGIKKLLEQ